MTAVMLDLQGHELTAEERDILNHPAVGGVIYFTRNYHDPEQMAELVRSTRAAARHRLLLAVDHEGGRVQRFRNGFTQLPAMASLAKAVQGGESVEQVSQWSQELGWLMASEVQALDIDISFAPILDVNGISEVIGDRAFGDSQELIVPLARAFMKGMHLAGMKTTGKHFPGHGSVAADSHIAIPVDERSFADIEQTDLVIFEQLLPYIDALMPAHVIYPDVCELPAGFSPFWIQQILKQQMGFDGVVFSDDLAMQGATVVGSMPERAHAALAAGCDMVLACNDPSAAVQVLEALEKAPQLSSDKVYQALSKGSAASLPMLQKNSRWGLAQNIVERLS